VIDGSRRERIARGSGTTVEDVNRLLDARKQMEKLMKGMSRGQMPDLAAMMSGQAPAPGMAAPARRKATKSNKKKKRSKARR
jgi:signal recognition particle subunit SRP54